MARDALSIPFVRRLLCGNTLGVTVCVVGFTDGVLYNTARRYSHTQSRSADPHTHTHKKWTIFMKGRDIIIAIVPHTHNQALERHTHTHTPNGPFPEGFKSLARENPSTRIVCSVSPYKKERDECDSQTGAGGLAPRACVCVVCP